MKISTHVDSALLLFVTPVIFFSFPSIWLTLPPMPHNILWLVFFLLAFHVYRSPSFFSPPFQAQIVRSCSSFFSLLLPWLYCLDGLACLFLVNCKQYISLFMHNFQQTTFFFYLWKHGHVTPILKNGDLVFTINYRSLSLLSYCSEIRERYLKNCRLNELADFISFLVACLNSRKRYVSLCWFL